MCRVFMVVLISTMMICSCSTVALRWFVSHNDVSVKSTNNDKRSTVCVTERRRPLTTKNSFKKKLYVNQIFSSDSLFNVSEQQFYVLYGSNRIKPSIYKVSLAEKYRLKEPTNLLPLSALLFTFHINAKTNDSIFIIEKDIPNKGDSTVICIDIAAPIKEMDDVDENNFYEVGTAYSASNRASKWALRRPSLYDDMPLDKDEYIQDFNVKFITYEESSNSIIFSYEGYRYRIPLDSQIVDKEQIKQSSSIEVRIKFNDCLECKYDKGRLPSAKIIGFL